MDTLKIITKSNNETVVELVDLIGAESTLSIIERFGGGFIYVPLLETISKDERNRVIYSDFLSGMNVNQLRQKYGLSATTIRDIIYNMRRSGKARK